MWNGNLGPTFEIYPSDKTMIAIACSKNDFAKCISKNKHNIDFFIMKADPVCPADDRI